MHLVTTQGDGFGILGAMKKKATNKMTVARSLPARGKGPKAKRRDLADRIIALIEEARGKVAKAVNVALVYTYYEVGRMIVEDEQGGKRRAAYGKAQLATLSRRLTDRFGRGWSADNLERMRKFFLMYSSSTEISANQLRKSAGTDRGKEIRKPVAEIQVDSRNPVR